MGAYIGQIELIPDDTLAPGMLGFRHKDGTRYCAACGCREDEHCKYGHECLTNQGTDEECRCAKFIAALPICGECGHRFGALWQLQNHSMPTPTCRRAAWGAAGKFARPAEFVPPLKPVRN